KPAEVTLPVFFAIRFPLIPLTLPGKWGILFASEGAG
ncbi:MAG: hypothetical protein H6Q97_710, partial [Nitrospirae bacterium]|nr:hypothetical protein [Nitrospirota bacterium]